MLIHARTNIYNLNYHLVWITKYRKMIFVTTYLRHVMKHILKRIARNHGVTIHNYEVLPEHIHMLVSFPPHMAISSVIKSFKGRSARIWFNEFPKTKKKLYGGHLWAPTFYAGSVGDMSKETIKKYINNQLINYRK